ncbi:bacillithiol biosynthesis cysteine-adding enzyme BshC [Algoriphagus ratkowskyi]|uniref:Putative cysteine ligase BshC n=1 Tax=Algoriphagus ratkowskyi TaxID=57028 RepID=A0A2W7R6G2_9BACT|nr:bacillithiol biosynthesis cysteine-adding enzyme BshC [Algoriphagus ratkowskyi]PZX54746.1 bacillithiol biosynthesis cysteine-adding enzyme BshC [Algoriphagus ratkowskyi]TXD77052.1 bacillithiol biosynthesis cysteine-adding enzyme BshC [Algoriphagus ratkowskyi]
MKKHCVELQKTGQFSQFFLDYIGGKKVLAPFYAHLPKLESFKQAIEQKTFSEGNRNILVEALQSQYANLEVSHVVSANISSLASNKTFTVTTGHQLNLFTGPLYFIYKIVSTINLAKKLAKTYPEYKFVPVYWMATEDHDFDEINYFKLDGKKYEWSSEQTGAVGDFELDKSFKAFLKTVSFAPEVFVEAYSSSKTLAEAVRKYVNSLFGDEGLLIVDGDDVKLKSEFTEVILSDLFEHKPFEKASEATEALQELGYDSQIFPREINFFYLDKGVRERIEKMESGFGVVNTEFRFTDEEMKALVEKHPERFSPNVVLRPLYQEIILPNLAYLGGPAEVVYWLQLKGVFDHFDVPFPMILPRNFALLINEKVKRKMSQLNWDMEDLFVDVDHWKKTFVKAEASMDIELNKQKEVISMLFDSKGKEALHLEKTLKNAFEAGKVRSLKIIDQMASKLRKAEERRLHTQIERASCIQELIKPGGSPQERVVNMMQFYMSNPHLISELLDCFDPLDFRMMVLENES